jgi:transposase
MSAAERTEVINEEIKICGYFVIITSEPMTAQEALELYKGRDASEKLFRGDKTYLGNQSMRVYSNESMEAKIFVEFVALIIRNRI